jgi:hypothetical protein
VVVVVMVDVLNVAIMGCVVADSVLNVVVAPPIKNVPTSSLVVYGIILT